MKVTYNIDHMINTPLKMEWVSEMGEELLREAGVTKYWDNPEKGIRIFEVETMPKNSAIFGIYWEEV